MDIVLSKNGVKCAVFKISDLQRFFSSQKQVLNASFKEC